MAWTQDTQSGIIFWIFALQTYKILIYLSATVSDFTIEITCNSKLHMLSHTLSDQETEVTESPSAARSQSFVT